MRTSVAWLISTLMVALVWVLAVILFLVLGKRLFRREWVAAIVVALFFSLNFLGLPSPQVTLPIAALSTGLLVVIAIRFGLLAAIVCEGTSRLLSAFVITTDTSAWYFYLGPLAAGVVLAVALWGFRIAKVPASASASG